MGCDTSIVSIFFVQVLIGSSWPLAVRLRIDRSVKLSHLFLQFFIILLKLLVLPFRFDVIFQILSHVGEQDFLKVQQAAWIKIDRLVGRKENRWPIRSEDYARVSLLPCGVRRRSRQTRRVNISTYLARPIFV